MAALVIDIGNTFIKIGVFEQQELLYNEQCNLIEPRFISELLTRYRIGKVIVSKVTKGNDVWASVLTDKVPLVHFTSLMATGIINHYQPPQSLGTDRLAAVMGAKASYPGESSLVIDGGTCVTYDWIDQDGNYYGGSISPGLAMRFKALNNYTAGLPLINADENFRSDHGSDTASAIRSGVQNGIKYELNGFIDAYNTKGRTVNIVLTGGDSIFFDRLLKNSIFAPCIKNEPHLVLKGLNAALQTNND